MQVQSQNSHQSLIEQLLAEKQILETRIATLEREVTEMNVTASELALELAVQYAIGRVIETTTSTAEAILDIVEVICEIIGWDMGMVWIIDSQTNRLTLSECWYDVGYDFRDFEAISRKTAFAIHEGLPGKVWQNGKPVWVDDMTLDSDLLRASAARAAGVHAAFGLPIQTSDHIIGVIEFFNHQVRQQDNNMLWMLLSVGSQIGLFIERRQAEEELRRRAEEIEDLYNNAPCGYHTLDAAGVFVRVNATELQWLGYSHDDLIGKKCFTDLLTLDSAERFQAAFERLREHGWVSDVEVEMVRKDGSTMPVLLNAAAITDSDGQFVKSSATIFDITERTRVEAAAREQSKVLAATEERQRLARELHDSVSQTLFSASLVAQALPLLWDVEPAEVKKSLGELTRLTRGALAEMRMLMIELRPEAVIKADIGELLQYLSDALTGRTQLLVDLVVEGNHPLLPEVQVALYRIVQEVFDNIIRHARATQIDVKLQRDEDSVILKMRDNGRGFDATSIADDEYFGIRIMRERAAAINAQLTISSQVGEGTEIVVIWQALQHCAKE